MLHDNPVTHENFRLLLSWLDPEPDVAAKEYERIRLRLIKFFSCRGCYEAESLADNTIDRVTLKAPKIVKEYVGRPDLYFYGVAKNIHKEWLRAVERERHISSIDFTVTEDVIDQELDCLESCLDKLSAETRELVLEYYRNEKRAKIETRKNLASRLGISTGALQIRVSRIRAQLSVCVSECISGV